MTRPGPCRAAAAPGVRPAPARVPWCSPRRSSGGRKQGSRRSGCAARGASHGHRPRPTARVKQPRDNTVYGVVFGKIKPPTAISDIRPPMTTSRRVPHRMPRGDHRRASRSAGQEKSQHARAYGLDKAMIGSAEADPIANAINGLTPHEEGSLATHAARRPGTRRGERRNPRTV
jgi:hypothetical protein